MPNRKGRAPPTDASSTLDSSSEQSPRPPSGGTPNLLRRKVPVEDEMGDARRLVEYFVVISSQPRWNAPNTRSSPRRKTRQLRSPSSTKVSKKEGPTKASSKWMPLGRKATPSESVDGQKKEEQAPPTPESPLASPPPQEQAQQDDDGNIRMPETTESEYTFQPMITERYPPTDYPDSPLNPMLVQFCYPHSDIIVPSTTYVMPRIHHFVLTTEKGGKIYGTCLTIHEDYSPSNEDPYHLRRNETVHSDSGELDIEVTMENGGRKRALYIPRVLCLLSTWPYLTAFREYLTQLYRLATTTNLMDAPLERFILNLCREIPAPPPGAFEIQVPIMTSTIRFWAPPAKLPIPYVALPYQTLFDCLDVDNVLEVWYSLVLERSVLLVSSQYSILTVCAEILCSLLFPMQWSHLYIPLLPRFLSPMLEAPFPYLCGVIGENWMHARQYVSDETMIVDLDTNTITYESHAPVLPPVPSKKWDKLREALHQCAGDMFWDSRGLVGARRQVEKERMSEREFNKLREQQGDQRWKEKLNGFDYAFNLAYTPDSPNLLDDTSGDKHQSQSDKVQEAFLRFLVSTFKGYRRFLCIPDVDSAESPNVGGYKRWSQHRSFDRDGFIATHKPENRPFMNELCLSQLFDDFITKRLYSPGEPDVIFFDQSIDAKVNRSRLKIKKVDTPFLQSAQAHKTLNVVTAVSPNTEGLPYPPEGTPEEKRTFVYPSWPEKFDPALFGTPRPIPRIITAEFDRQSALVSRLRAYQTEEGADACKILDFFGGDFDPNPEVATFTVFFFAYSSVIGKEWQEYQRKRQELGLPSPSTAEDVEMQLHLNGNEANCSPHEYETNADLPRLDEGEIVVDDEQDIGLIGSILDCSSSDCDICPKNADGTQMFQETFLAQFSGSQVMLSRTSTPSKLHETLVDDDAELAEFEETREVAVAQLDLAFSVLTTMKIRGLGTDPDAFKSLMEACGRCGDTDRALSLISKMKKDGFVTDGELYSSLMQAFAQGDGSLLPSPSNTEDNGLKASAHSDAYASFLKKKFHFAERDAASRAGTLSSSDDGESDVMSALSSDNESELHSSSVVSDFLYNALWGSPKSALQQKRRSHKNSLSKRRRRRRSSFSALTSNSKSVDKDVTAPVQKQNILGESLLEFLYPGLNIDTGSDSCPLCSKQLSEDDIVSGWIPCQFEDFTTACPQCKHRFVPRFSVICPAPTFEGSQGPATPLYCELLSPWVLRKELDSIIHGSDGIEGMLKPEWRSGTDIRATLWWNLIVSFNRYRLPVSFLLQGSFKNRLINPTPDT